MSKYSQAMLRSAFDHQEIEQEASIARETTQPKGQTASRREDKSIPDGKTRPKASTVGQQESIDLSDRRNGAAPRSAENVWPFLLTPDLRNAYLQLNHTMLLAAGNGALKTVVFTSCEENHERALLVAEFAALLAADLGRKVLLTDGDHQRRGLSDIFRRSGHVGLHESFLSHNGAKGSVVDSRCPGLVFLPNEVKRSEIVFHPQDLQDWMQEVKEAFDYVLIDTPALSQGADGVILGKHADGVILVAQAERTDRFMLAKAKEQLENAHCRILGVVLTQTREYLPPFLRRYAGLTL